MSFPQWLLTLWICITLPIWLLKLLYLVYYSFRKLEIPSGAKEPVKLRLYHLMIVSAFHMGKLLERLGICSQINFVRFMMDLTPSGKNSNLLINDKKFEYVPVRIYQPKHPSTELRRGLLYLHGGCCIFGSKRSYERICRHLARESDSVVVFVEFRLAPEHQHPIQVMDCLTATMHFMKNAENYGVDPNRIVLIGESSGGTLCASVARELVKRAHFPKIRAQVLIYPFLQLLNAALPSHQQNYYGPGLSMKRVLKLGTLFLNENIRDYKGVCNNAHVPENMRELFNKCVSTDYIPEEFKARGYKPPLPVAFSAELSEKMRVADETLQSPILDEDTIIRQLPETYILTCEYDLLRDDGLLYKKRLEDNGIPVTWNHLKDGFHGVIMFIDAGPFTFSSTKPAYQGILNFIKLV